LSPASERAVDKPKIGSLRRLRLMRCSPCQARGLWSRMTQISPVRWRGNPPVRPVSAASSRHGPAAAWIRGLHDVPLDPWR
jgi:hypothetical protein